MKIKVCGMTRTDNINELIRLPVDMIGLIFYEKSSRYAGHLLAEKIRALSPGIRKAGVFVHAPQAEIEDRTKQYDLQAIQLHGNESPDFCKKIKQLGITVIKAFPVSEPADFDRTKAYAAACDYFLFDTKTPQYGGSGQPFDWKILDAYRGSTPFFLSGGIAPDDAGRIKAIQHPSFCGVDLNSRFELSPGIKNIDLLRTFIETLKS
ncbi:MAG: phosphoribosylanthranilate isomerase [Dysgonamonadaceae bacterium]|jgi:phosphoribosylanthranilate isomerase|nr:phosphoribosylanthranilate isomerase [Dysgonamonadaceae bacterium]